MKKVLLLLVIAFACSKAEAATINAASCSQSNVQTAINSAASGDTVQVPGGTATWGSVSIPNTKYITINGGGCTVTSKLNIDESSSGTSRVTNFTFSGGTNIDVNGDPSTRVARIDHNSFTCASNCTFINIYDNPPVLIDNNTFVADGGAEMIHNLGNGPGSAAGWSDNVTPGSANFVYIETNTFTYNASGNPAYFFGTSAVQSYYGARTVFRYNTCNMCQIDEHGTAGNIGARWFEIYNNTFNTTVANANQSDYIVIRAGSGVIFNNLHNGSNSGAGNIKLYEEDSGYPALYQPGRGISQNLSPVYVWNNAGSMPVSSGSSNVQLNRDYYTSALQPATLKRWELSTDNSSTTYVYVPYTYPYPTSGAPIASISPSSLTFNNQLVLTSSSPARILTLTNTGTSTLTITSISITGSNAADFSKTTTCGATLGISASCTISVTFSPLTSGRKNANISIVDDALGTPHTAAITGFSLALQPPPAPPQQVTM